MKETGSALPASRAASLEAYRARIARALAYVQERLGGEVSLEGAAEAACFSKYHFHRIFSAGLGESFADCVRRLRLERAANLLENSPAMSVTEVAMAAGFSSPSVLSRLFAERFGTPPSRWREERLGARAEGLAARPGSGEAPALWTATTDTVNASGVVSVRAVGPLRFASCLHIGPYGPEVQEAWERLFRWAGPRGLLGAGRLAGIAWDNPDYCEPGSCRYSACLEIGPAVEPSGEALLVEFPARTYLVLADAGAAGDISLSYSRVYKVYLPRSGFEPADAPAIELYREGRSGALDFDIALPVRPLELR